jgi:hypothetical protein
LRNTTRLSAAPACRTLCTDSCGLSSGNLQGQRGVAVNITSFTRLAYTSRRSNQHRWQTAGQDNKWGAGVEGGGVPKVKWPGCSLLTSTLQLAATCPCTTQKNTTHEHRQRQRLL